MNFIEEWGFNVKLGQEEAFQQWVVANEDALRQSSPKGSEYLGIYAAVYTTEKQAGSFKLLVRHDSYADLDAAASAGKDANSEFGRLSRELIKFWNAADTAPWSRTLLKSIVEATVFASE
jgi:hypothetical protein